MATDRESIQVWRVRPDLTGWDYESSIIPVGWESAWGLLEMIADWLDSGDGDKLTIASESMPLVELLNLDCCDQLFVNDPRSMARLREQVGDESVDAAIEEFDREHGGRYTEIQSVAGRE